MRQDFVPMTSCPNCFRFLPAQLTTTRTPEGGVVSIETTSVPVPHADCELPTTFLGMLARIFTGK